MSRLSWFVSGCIVGFIAACWLVSGRGSESVPGGAVTDPASGAGPRPISELMELAERRGW